MHVDQTGQQCHSLQIDSPRAGGNGRPLCSHGGDPAVRYRYLGMFHDAACDHIQHAIRRNHNRVGVHPGRRGE
jgi:hypothetical protein